MNFSTFAKLSSNCCIHKTPFPCCTCIHDEAIKFEQVIELEENFILKMRTLAIKTHIFVKKTPPNQKVVLSIAPLFWVGAKIVDKKENSPYCYFQSP